MGSRRIIGGPGVKELHALIPEIKGKVDSVLEHSFSLIYQKKVDFEDWYSRIIENGLNEISIRLTRISRKMRSKKTVKSEKPYWLYKNTPIEIFSFMHNFSIPLSNNLAEIDTRMAKLQRKSSGTFRSVKGLTYSVGLGDISQRLRKITGRFSHRLLALFREIHSHCLALNPTG